jgi:serine/threonine protein kinase
MAMLSKSQQLGHLDGKASGPEPPDGMSRSDDPSCGLWREIACDAEDQLPTESGSEQAAAQTRKAHVPHKLGPVALLRPIGRGGMGVVWLGWHELLRTEVAVKFILTRDTTAEADKLERERFLIGARAAASIRHPGLTRILHADIVNNIPYLVMEYVPGRTIAQVQSERGGFDLPTALSILDATAEIVAHLHEHDVVHGDIKPANLLLNRAGELYLTDFGLACSPGPAPMFIAGTPAYMAPEMFEGKVYPRSDVYALGIMAFELMTGCAPSNGDCERQGMSHAGSPLPLVLLHQRGVPNSVITFLERATNRKPLFRIKTAGQFVTILRSELSACYSPRDARERLFALLGGCGGQVAQTPSPSKSCSRPSEPHAGDADSEMTSLMRMAHRKREEQKHGSAGNRTLTRAVAPAMNTGSRNFDARCGRCGRMTLTAPRELRCERCGAAMQLVSSNVRQGKADETVGVNSNALSTSRSMLVHWIHLLRAQIW